MLEFLHFMITCIQTKSWRAYFNIYLKQASCIRILVNGWAAEEIAESNAEPIPVVIMAEEESHNVIKRKEAEPEEQSVCCLDVHPHKEPVPIPSALGGMAIAGFPSFKTLLLQNCRQQWENYMAATEKAIHLKFLC